MKLKHLGVITALTALLLSPFIHDSSEAGALQGIESGKPLERKSTSMPPVETNKELPSAEVEKNVNEQEPAERAIAKPPTSALRRGLAPKTSAPEGEEECGEISVPIPDMKVFPLNNHLFGDSTIGDNEEKQLEIRAYLKQTPMRIWLTVEVEVQERRVGVNTHYLGVSSAVVYDARQQNYGCQIDNVLNSKIEPRLAVFGAPAVYGGGEEAWAHMGRDSIVETQYGWWRALNIEQDSYTFSAAENNNSESVTGLLSGGSCVVNTDGDDNDKLECTNFKFKPLRLKLKKNDPQRCDPFHLVEHPPIWLKPLKHYKGDSDIKGNGRDIWVADSRTGRKSPYLRVLNGERVQIVGNLGIRERLPDFSSFDASFALDIASLWDVPPQCRIVSAQIDSEHFDQSQLINAIKDQNYHVYDGTGLFKKLICRTDTGTDDGMKSDEGGVGCKLYPRTIKINLAHAGPHD